MSPCTRLLADADSLLRTAGQGLWPRAAAFLIRMALEACMSDFWLRTQPGVEDCDMQAQLLCLTGYHDQDTARLAARAWAALSAACHYHGYELSPTVGELRTLYIEVRALAARLT
ncbi:hypothetical protein [Streptosporangium sp. NBC_01756]|uniref:hypothetical protein n=1 Tax=Streptosporangium sp. NBC_01756 TaxID=2975950 RepID=UPI002DD8279D|nr:hypothetical protein [Streptosporangium sp. NBC_01756]WSC86965.1 hypothetical protein OIE48_01710 [Streptosporangium sp. NBC_01756]